MVRENQFILSRIDARNGAFGLIPDSLDGAIVSNDFPVFNLDKAQIDPFFLNWMSKTNNFVDLCIAASEGTTNRVRLQEDRFLAIPIPLPPLPEQKRIVARIEALATKVEEVNGLKKDVAEETEALVVSTHLKLSGNRTRLLGEIVELDEEQVPVLPSEQYPQVGVKSFGRGLFAKSSLAGTETTYRIFNRLYSGALVLSQVKAWEGAIAICEHTLAGWYVSPEYRTFRCIPGESLPGYLSAIVRTEWFWGKLTHATRGVGARRERTRPEEFLNIRISIPEVEQQKKGEEIYRKVELLKGPQVENAVELDALLPSILDKAIQGEL
ncbi:MAG: restriction endonuclease subunit S [Nitrospinae bacterium]|nr:restriction endonuclease subunit S [Nitrospinota bacterium]